jgi:DNA-binding LacI/PurR family transcriptional regulator
MAGIKSTEGNVDMQRIADLAGVSRSTVSRALNDSPLVNERTKEKIRLLAEKHQFVMNETARSLRLKRSNIICLVLMHDIELGAHLSDPFFLRMVGWVVDYLAEASHDLMLYHKPVETASEFLNTRVYRQCDGAIFIGQGTIHEELNKLAGFKKPIVVWGADLPGRSYKIVGADNIAGGHQATEHLISEGCSRIAFFGDTKKPELAMRYEGYCNALRKAGLEPDPDLQLALPMERGAADKLIEAFIQNATEFDGVVCSSDVLAATTISILQRLGKSVPTDVAVTGYDDLEIGARMNPSLTTVSQDIQGGAEQLVKKMMGLLAGKRARDSIRESSLIVRESSLHSRR